VGKSKLVTDITDGTAIARNPWQPNPHVAKTGWMDAVDLVAQRRFSWRLRVVDEDADAFDRYEVDQHLAD